jgi:hypothetical protein
MADPNTQPANQPAPAATDQQTPPTTDDPTGTNGGQGEEKRFTQAELEAKISDRLKRERELAATKAQKDKEAAEAESLKEQQKFKELASQHEAKLAELGPQVETLTAERDRLVAIVTAAIDAETKDWAKEVKELLPDGADVLTRYAAVERTRGLAARLQATGPLPGNGPNPRPTGSAASNGVQTIIEEKRGTGRYAPF